MQNYDELVFRYNEKTLNYQVTSSGNIHFLYNKNSYGSEIFNLLEIKDKYAFCENIVGYRSSGDFPVMKSLEDLEQVVDALYQRIINISIPKFKEDEKVRILSKLGRALDYPCNYTPKMEEFTNTTSVISIVNRISLTDLKRDIQYEKYEEPFYYMLKGNGFLWTSAMLESVSEDNNKKEEIPPKFNIGDKVKVKALNKDHHYGINLNTDMLKYSNQEFIIADRRSKYSTILNEECDGYSYFLMGVYGWVWSSDMLEKSENKTKHKLDTALWTASEPRNLSVMQKESIEIYDVITTDSTLLPPKLAKADINTQTITFGNIKTIIDTNYKLNFNVKPLKF